MPLHHHRSSCGGKLRIFRRVAFVLVTIRPFWVKFLVVDAYPPCRRAIKTNSFPCASGWYGFSRHRGLDPPRAALHLFGEKNGSLSARRSIRHGGSNCTGFYESTDLDPPRETRSHRRPSLASVRRSGLIRRQPDTVTPPPCSGHSFLAQLGRCLGLDRSPAPQEIAGCRPASGRILKRELE